jgi:hypothetical protein
MSENPGNPYKKEAVILSPAEVILLRDLLGPSRSLIEQFIFR